MARRKTKLNVTYVYPDDPPEPETGEALTAVLIRATRAYLKEHGTRKVRLTEEELRRGIRRWASSE